MNLGTAFVEVRPDTKAFSSELTGDVESAGQQAAGRLRQVFTAAAIGAGLKRVIDDASNLQQAVGGTEAVFASSSAAIDAWAENSAQAVGLSERAYREFTSQIGGQLRGFGFGLEESAEKANQLVTLGADLAATYGGDVSEAVNAVTAALRGEFDPLERYGAALRATEVNARAVALGLAESTAEVDGQARAQATLSLIMERSSAAQGQFAREADTAAGASAIAAAEAENASASLGENFLPIYERIVTVVGQVADGFGKLPGPVQTAIVAVAAIAALSGPIKTLTTLGRSILPLAAAGFDRLALGAYGAAGSMGSIGLAAGGVGIALGLLAGAYFAVQNRQKEAAERADEYTAVLERQAEGAEGAANALFAERLSEVFDLDLLEEYGFTIEQVTAAIQGQSEALAQVRAEEERLEALANTEGLDQEERSRLNVVRAILEEAAAYRTAQEAQDAVSAGAEEAAEAQRELGGAVELTAEQVDELVSALDELYGLFLDVPEATREVAAANEEAFVTLVENGVTAFDDLSEAGRENREVLDGMVESTKALAEATLDNGGSALEAAAQFEVQRQALLDARDAGLITTETFQFYDQLLRDAITTVETEFQTPGLSEAAARVVDFRDRVLGVPPDRQTAFFANTTPADSTIRLFEERLANATRDRSVTIGVNIVGDALNLFASGTPSAPPGLALVGEEGPELVDFRGGERVYTAEETAALARSGSGGGGSAAPAGRFPTASEIGAAVARALAQDPRAMYVAVARAGNTVSAGQRQAMERVI